MTRTLRVTVDRQGGVFTAAQAKAWGLSEMALVRAVRRGELVRLRRGIYGQGDRWRALTVEEQHLFLVRGLLLVRPRCRATHHSALLVHGLPVHDIPLETICLAHDGSAFRRSGVVVRALPAGEPLVSVDGIPTVSAATAVLQTTLTHGLEAGVVAADAALNRRLAGFEQLCARAEVLAPGSRRLEALLAAADAAAESPGESLTRLVLRSLGHEPRSQVVVHDERGAFVGRVDFLVGDRVVVEFDGRVKYGGDGGRDALVREKAREDALRALGYAVVRLTWADLRRPEWVDRQVREALARTPPVDRGTRSH